MPDWVFYKPDFLKSVDYQQLLGFTRFKHKKRDKETGKIGKEYLSDHDGIMVTFEVEKISEKKLKAAQKYIEVMKEYKERLTRSITSKLKAAL